MTGSLVQYVNTRGKCYVRTGDQDGPCSMLKVPPLVRALGLRREAKAPELRAPKLILLPDCCLPVQLSPRSTHHPRSSLALEFSILVIFTLEYIALHPRSRDCCTSDMEPKLPLLDYCMYGCQPSFVIRERAKIKDSRDESVDPHYLAIKPPQYRGLTIAGRGCSFGPSISTGKSVLVPKGKELCRRPRLQGTSPRHLAWYLILNSYIHRVPYRSRNCR